jgi:putative MATE family efflux protein
MDAKTKKILHAPMRKLILELSVPSVLAMVLYGLNNLLDYIFIGHTLEEKALSGVGLTFPFIQLIMAVGTLIGSGAGMISSRYLGSGKAERLRRLLGVTNILCLVCAICVFIPMFYFAESLLGLMKGEASELKYALSYLKSSLVCSFFWVHGLALNMIIRSEGKMGTAAAMMGVGLIIDIVLKAVFINLFHLGVAGAAWATNIGMIGYSAMGIVYFARNENIFGQSWRQILLDWSMTKDILKNGLPLFTLSAMGLIQTYIVLHSLTTLDDTNEVAFYTVANRILIFLSMPVMGLMRAFQPIAGINYGYGNFRKLIRYYWLFVFISQVAILPFWLVVILFPKRIFLLFTPSLITTLTQIRDFRYYILILPLLPIIYMGLTVLPAIERHRETTLLIVGRQIVLFVPLMILMPHYFGISFIYWGSTLIDLITVGVSMWFISNSFQRIVNFDKKILN